MVYIIGAGGHAKVIIDTLETLNEDIGGIYDEQTDSCLFRGYPVRGKFSDFLALNSGHYILAIGSNLVRKKLFLKIGAPCSSVAVHPTAFISNSVKIGSGSVVMANVSINADSIVGNHAIVNTGASVDHDCALGNFVHISPKAALAGNVLVGEGTHIGIGAVIIQGIKIGKWATIGAGAVVIRDVPDYAIVVGNPAKIIKFNQIQENE
ncbi:acetyltransferase [Pedobacter deserti]|uniref:acetyltransferase n=1 Tax=Pedobacter deserti TaxID=2817382 RepID=UPI00210A2D25|nr:acetyltransferase [Pedobacter sp. SYSU D00382]